MILKGTIKEIMLQIWAMRLYYGNCATIKSIAQNEEVINENLR